MGAGILPETVDIALDTTGMNRVLAFNPGNFNLAVLGGITIDAVNKLEDQGRGFCSSGSRPPNLPFGLGIKGVVFPSQFDSSAFEGKAGPNRDFTPYHRIKSYPRFSMNESYQSVYDEVSKCNRCGFCQAHCPIFDITGDERNVARGHNVHVRKLAEGNLEINADFKDPLFECLLCRACVANCFPAVRTDKSVIAGRAEYMRRIGQPGIMHFLFHSLLPDHDKMAKFVRLAALGKNSGMGKLARAMGILNWFGKDLGKVEGIVEKLPTTFFRDRTQELRLDPPKADIRAAYFVGCGFNFVLPEVSKATLEVLVESGAAARIADNCCCGLPAYGYGDLEAARHMAKTNIEVLEKTKAEVVVTECGSCSAFLKDYPELFENDPAWQKRAKELSKKVKGFSEFMLDRLPTAAGTAKFSTRVTYHDPCHMSRYQKVVSQPRALLKKMPGMIYLELPEADRCCGAAGSYNVMHYEQSMKVLARKIGNVQKIGAEILTTECPGCIIQLRYGAKRAGLETRVAHISELVRETIGKKDK